MLMKQQKYKVYFNNIRKSVPCETIIVYIEQPEKSDLWSLNDIANIAVRKSGKTREWLQYNGWLFESVELKETILIPIEEFVSYYNKRIR